MTAFNNFSEENINFFTGDYDKIKEIVKNILKEKFNYSDIVILAKGKGNVEFIYNHMSYSLQKNCIKNVETQNNNILITTYSAIKNLKNKICIFADFDTVNYNVLTSLTLSHIQHLYIHTKNNSSDFISKIKEHLKNKTP